MSSILLQYSTYGSRNMFKTRYPAHKNLCTFCTGGSEGNAKLRSVEKWGRETGKSQFGGAVGFLRLQNVGILSPEWLGAWKNRVSDVVTRGWLLALRATKMFILMTPLWGIYPNKPEDQERYVHKDIYHIIYNNKNWEKSTKEYLSSY